MPKVTVNFTRCVQDSQEYGSTDDHMVSRVFFTIETEGRSVPCYADLRQTVGSDYLKGDIEVAPPKTQKDEKPYRGPFNHEAFREQATAYYRAYVGSSGMNPLRSRRDKFEDARQRVRDPENDHVRGR